MKPLVAYLRGPTAIYVGLGLAGLILFAAGMGVQAYWAPLPGLESPDPGPTVNGSVPEWVQRVPRRSGDKGIGDPDAPVRIVEYTDFQCPYCRRHSRRAFPRIVRDFVLDGDVYYVIRHFPLSRAHPRAVPAALASECAARQGKFWPYKEMLMNNQKRLSGEMFLQLARTVGVSDRGRFRTCLENREPMSTVREEFQAGQDRGVRATPTLFVGDEKISGAQPYRKIRQVIQRQLDA